MAEFSGYAEAQRAVKKALRSDSGSQFKPVILNDHDRLPGFFPPETNRDISRKTACANNGGDLGGFFP